MKLILMDEVEIDPDNFAAIRHYRAPAPLARDQGEHRLRLVEVSDGVRTGRWMVFGKHRGYDQDFDMPNRSPTTWWYYID